MKKSGKLNIILFMGIVLLLAIIGNPNNSFSGEETCQGPVDLEHACEINAFNVRHSECIDWEWGPTIYCNQPV